MDFYDTNRIVLNGRITTEAEPSHTVCGDMMVSFYISVPRLSKYVDTLPVTAPARIMPIQNLTGENVTITGQIRTYNKFENGVNRLKITVFAKEICPDGENAVNSVRLQGYICKPVIYRTTPLNREIADILIAVNRSYNKSDYIPCIAWARNARLARGFSVGDFICVEGRMQSRQYEKILPDGAAQVRTAFEVSISQLKKQ